MGDKSVARDGRATISKAKNEGTASTTDDYDIVSKRSVEKIFYPKDPQFRRAFVSKFKRRSPLTNRKVWLRMRAIESIIEHFLCEMTSKRKVVVNLGCGPDPQAFRMIWQHKKQCKNVKFIDLDTPELIQKKVDIISSDPVFFSQLDGLPNRPLKSPIVFDHVQYCAIGCDLADGTQLQDILHNQLKLECNSVLFISEVSLARPIPHDYTDIFRLCSTFSDARFCFLEQNLPVAGSLVFAKTTHHDKVLPPETLPSSRPSRTRRECFSQTGWPEVHSIDLWNFWQHLCRSSSLSLNSVEPFSDWDTLSLWAGHHTLMYAATSEVPNCMPIWTRSNDMDINSPATIELPVRKLMVYAAPSRPKDNITAPDIQSTEVQPPYTPSIATSKPGNVFMDFVAKSIERITDAAEMEKKLRRSSILPVVAEGLDLGPCTALWTPECLKEKVGQDHPTIIHSASGPQMSFRDKNFSYETVSFGSFIDRAVSNAHVYLRALSDSDRFKLPADLTRDYPRLASDFKIPEELSYVEQYQHSSVLRISGNITMWLHYDVMANVLCQIKGSKRVILFPPKDVSKLEFPPGETTSNFNVFCAGQGKLSSYSLVETTLSEGEVLFIPACWPHTTAPAGQGLSVAVNVFFRNFEDKLYAAGRDVYGNRDPAMYQNGRKHVQKILSLLSNLAKHEAELQLALLAKEIRAKRAVEDASSGRKEANRIIASAKGVPEDVAAFYLDRLADELIDSSQK